MADASWRDHFVVMSTGSQRQTSQNEYIVLDCATRDGDIHERNVYAESFRVPFSAGLTPKMDINRMPWDARILLSPSAGYNTEVRIYLFV